MDNALAGQAGPEAVESAHVAVHKTQQGHTPYQGRQNRDITFKSRGHEIDRCGRCIEQHRGPKPLLPLEEAAKV